MELESYGFGIDLLSIVDVMILMNMVDAPVCCSKCEWIIRDSESGRVSEIRGSSMGNWVWERGICIGPRCLIP